MAKRFTDTEKWKKDWFVNLSNEGKLLWIYITDNCDHAGICDFSEKIFSTFLDFKITQPKIDELLKDKIQWIEENKFFIPSFVKFQYGTLNIENRVHKSVIDRIELTKEAPYKPLISPLQGAKDKDKDKDICSSLVLSSFLDFWNEYPKKVGKGDAEKAWKKIKEPKATLDLIITALEWQKKSDQWKKEGGQFIPNPATYLNRKHWGDEPQIKKGTDFSFLDNLPDPPPPPDFTEESKLLAKRVNEAYAKILKGGNSD